ncbi:MAG TPA: hypothetical protein VGE02_12850, partial [Gemmatimonadales bacterium]
MNAPVAPNHRMPAAPARPAGRRRAPTARLTVWARALALLALLGFGRATVVPPCEAHGSASDGAMHGAMHGAGQAAGGDAHNAASSGHGEQGAPHDDTCTCLGACHHAAAAAWLGSDAPRLRVVARAFLETAAPAGRPAISRTL